MPCSLFSVIQYRCHKAAENVFLTILTSTWLEKGFQAGWTWSCCLCHVHCLCCPYLSCVVRKGLLQWFPPGEKPFPIISSSKKRGGKGQWLEIEKKCRSMLFQGSKFNNSTGMLYFSAFWRKRISQPCTYSYHLFWLYLDLHDSEHISKLPYIIHPNYCMDYFSLQEIEFKETKHWFWNCISVLQGTAVGLRFTLLNPRIKRAKPNLWISIWRVKTQRTW